jgi:DNA-directed RNA polymerase subunit M/transcription elongation factor TFIIS
MRSIYLKACPRCSGDLIETKDVDGDCRRCLQCGFSRELSSPKLVDRRIEGRRKRMAA